MTLVSSHLPPRNTGVSLFGIKVDRDRVDIADVTTRYLPR